MFKNYELRATRTSQPRCLVLFGLILSIYLIENLPIISFNHSSEFIYIAKPIIWCGVIFIVWFFPRIRAKGKIRLQSFLRWWVIYLAAIYIVFLFLGGLIEGFGKSPYDISLIGIIKNIIILGSALVGRELIRAYLVNSLSDKHPVLTMSIISVFMTVVNLSINRINDLKGGFDTLQYMAEYALPQLSNNILATYLVYIGGASLSIIYLFIVQGFYWFCPILPNLKWITKGLIGILVPIFILMFVQYLYGKQSKKFKDNNTEKENPLGWILTSVFSVCIVWFAVGVFPIHPAVIATGSMKPMINPGDVVLVKKMSGNEVKLGDVIQFKSDNIYIFHRIIDVKEEKKEMKYKTKGDNNSAPDHELVRIADVKGKVIYVIPKIGWPTLLMKSNKNVPKEKVEF